MKYTTLSNQTLSESEVISLSPTFRDIKEKISRFGIKPTSKIVVQGEYDENTLSLDKYLMENITGLPNVDMEFIVRINYNDESLFFTSTSFKQQIVKEYSKSNPYLALVALSEIVDIELDPIVDNIRNLLDEERKDGVRLFRNTFVNLSYDNGEQEIEIDYQKLFEYFNWVVSKPSQNYDERLLDISLLSDFEFTEPTLDDSEESSEEDDTNGEDSDNNDTQINDRGGTGGSSSGGESIDDVESTTTITDVS